MKKTKKPRILAVGWISKSAIWRYKMDIRNGYFAGIYVKANKSGILKPIKVRIVEDK